MKEVKFSRSAMHGQVFLQVQIGQSVQHPRRELWISRRVGDANQVCKLDRLDPAILLHRNNCACHSSVLWNILTLAPTREVVQDRIPERAAPELVDSANQ